MIATAPRDLLALPIHENRPHWLLRSLPGWQGAHKARFGGNPGDAATLIVRVAVFQDATSARAAFVRLTPEQLYAFWPGRMAAPPEPLDAARRLPENDARVYFYPLRSPPESGDATNGQFTVLWQGRFVILAESIGVSAAELAPVLDVLLRSAAAPGEP